MTKSIQEVFSEIKAYSPTPELVKLLAVSKKQSSEKIKTLYSQGQRAFGENYVQEALEKKSQLDLDIEWHFIGHLQSNKVKEVVGKFALIHSVDSLKLAQLIDKKAAELGTIQKILLEINIGNEATKSGFSIEELKKNWNGLKQLKHISLCGLMCLPPAEVTESETETYFKSMASLLEELKKETISVQHPLSELSMGTSGDYLLALKNKATIIRLGTLLFGERI